MDQAWDSISLTRDLLALGYSSDELARLTRSGQLVHVRRGAYARTSDPELRGAEQHRRLVLATMPLLAPASVVSHVSAAVLHGLPVWSSRLGRVQLTRPDLASGKRRASLHVYAAPLTPSDVVELAGVHVTSAARTVADLGRVLPFDQAVVAADAALRGGCAAADLRRVLAGMSGWSGSRPARRVVAFADGRSESPGESLSRVRFAELGLPPPHLQYEVFDDLGVLVGRADFCWEAERTLGEFDGKVKYERLLEPGQSASDVVYAEKRREDALRDLGWEVVRWSWSDLTGETALALRIRRAFAERGQVLIRS